MLLGAYLTFAYVWAVLRLYVRHEQGTVLTNLDGLLFLLSPLTTPTGLTIMLASELIDLDAPLTDPDGEQE
jgi:hypothetical protein